MKKILHELKFFMRYIIALMAGLGAYFLAIIFGVIFELKPEQAAYLRGSFSMLVYFAALNIYREREMFKIIENMILDTKKIISKDGAHKL